MSYNSLTNYKQSVTYKFLIIKIILVNSLGQLKSATFQVYISGNWVHPGDYSSSGTKYYFMLLWN